VFIERRDKEDNLFRELQESSLKMIQERSGDIWTDYNVHDPGITILENLHYALYELSYVNSASFSDYLKNKSGQTDYTDYGLLPENELFAPSIVTPLDYEQQITGAFQEIEACRVLLADDHTYHIRVQVQPSFRTKALEEKIISLYHANRNLCETLGKLEFVSSLTEKEEEPERMQSPDCHPGSKQLRSPELFSPAYSSIQNDFPDNYGINRRGKPTGITIEHDARILQLKGYLLIFDYLLDNNYRLINQIPRFLSFSDNNPPDAISDIKIEGIEDLIDRQRKADSSLQDENWIHRQKAYYLDMLDVLYGEDTNQPFRNYPEHNLREKNRKRMELIRRFPELNVNRFRSFNIQDDSVDNVPAANRMIAALLDENPDTTHAEIDMFTRYKLNQLSDHQFSDQYPNLFISEPMEKADTEIEKIKPDEQPFNERRFGQFRRQLNLLWHHVVFDSFLKYGNNPEYYGIMPREEKNGFLLLFRYPGANQWINMGFFFEKLTLNSAANDLRQFVNLLNRCKGSFHLVEHILLGTSEANDWRSLTVVMPSTNERYSQRENCESLLRERLPAHLHIRFLWIGQEKMPRFEQLYFSWRKALSTGDQKEKARYGSILRDFIYKPS